MMNVEACICMNRIHQGIPEAYVPVIKAKISGVPLSLLMARLVLSSIPDELKLKDDHLLGGEECVRSLNGVSSLDILIYHKYSC